MLESSQANLRWPTDAGNLHQPCKGCWDMTPDIGMKLLDSLYEQMMIEDQAVRRQRGFILRRTAQHST